MGSFTWILIVFASVHWEPGEFYQNSKILFFFSGSNAENLARKTSASCADGYWSLRKSIPPSEGDVASLTDLLGSKQLHAGSRLSASLELDW